MRCKIQNGLYLLSGEVEFAEIAFVDQPWTPSAAPMLIYHSRHFLVSQNRGFPFFIHFCTNHFDDSGFAQWPGHVFLCSGWPNNPV